MRRVEAKDTEFLRRMCFEAVYSRDPSPPSLEEGIAPPTLRRYFEAWGRPGDDGVIALNASEEPEGAAWYRVFPAAEPSFGWIAEDVPELVIAVRPSARSRGLGSRLMNELIAIARSSGFRALSLSVEDGNRSVNLYNRLGFRRAYRDELEKAWTMVLEIPIT